MPATAKGRVGGIGYEGRVLRRAEGDECVLSRAHPAGREILCTVGCRACRREDEVIEVVLGVRISWSVDVEQFEPEVERGPRGGWARRTHGDGQGGVRGGGRNPRDRAV